MFGNFGFGKGKFGQAGQSVATPVTGTATFTGFTLHIVCRGVVSQETASIDQRWMDKLLGKDRRRRKKLREQRREIEQPVLGLARFRGFGLQVSLRQPLAKPGVVARAARCHSLAIQRKVCVRSGVRVRIHSSLHFVEARPMPKAAHVRFIGSRLVNRSAKPVAIGIHNPTEYELMAIMISMT